MVASRLIFVVALALSGTSSFADGEIDIPFGKFRAFTDRCVVALTLGFMGKPKFLYGVPTPKIIWGPYSLKNIFTHRLGVFVGGGPLFGETFFGHPMGEVSVYAGNGYLSIEVNHYPGDRVISRGVLSQLQRSYPQIKIFAGSDPFHNQEVNLSSNERHTFWKIIIQETAGLSGPDFERAARVVAYQILMLP